MIERTSTPATIAESPTNTIVLDVTGMKCAGCVSAVEKHLLNQAGVESACVNLLTGVAAISTAATTVTASELAAKLTASGFPAQPRTVAESNDRAIRLQQRQDKYAQESKQLVWQLITAGVLLVLSAVGHFTQPTTHLHHGSAVLTNFWWHWGLATLAIAFPGRAILVDGWRSLWHGNPNMNTLVGLGIITSYTASVVALLLPGLGWECFFEEPVMIIGFITLGRTLEQQAKHRAATAFDRLLSLQPTVARLVSANPDRPQAIEIPVEQVKVGEYLRVLPGEKIPADGAIRWGQTTIDESLITGESIPLVKQAGDLVIAGTVNQSGAISIEVTRTGDDTTLSQIIALVEAAQTRKAPVQKLADTVAGYFTYGVLAIAILTGLFWYFIGIHNPNLMPPVSTLAPLKAAIAVMVVACPCALGLATPTAILVGTGIGAEAGLLIKGGDVLEAVQQLDTVVFDKTGTLTEGKPQVTDIFSPDTMSATELLRQAAAAESVTNHPLAVAIQQEAARLELTLPSVLEAHTEAGLGVSAKLLTNNGENQVIVGNQPWLAARGIEIGEDLQAVADKLTLTGKTVMYVAIAPATDLELTNLTIGLIGVTDRLRSDAIETVKQLQELGLRVVLLTGDKKPVAKLIAAELGITDIYSEVLPQDKARIVKSLQTHPLAHSFEDRQIESSKSPIQHRVAMVGDGINDAPALAQADLGIALNAGTDVAIDVADIILMRDRLLDVVYAIELSQATLTKIRQNLFWAAIYNIIGIPAAAGVLYWCGWGTMLSPSAAGALMALSSVSVVTNSLLLKLNHRRN
ncbi:heavy metal translocating P-type ATPase [Chamaesiphon minutus]|uniref:Copper/silver-translocating P-type ATPase n=1 Tax=Chamaesiphon minutus (strain ATCC 27169 / PCC 6605) TaxID=1173020 RepID=K9UI01_CHAP6|nr:heavy metal translocating P-type ATPase [Chamaesiphon minutus]AFY94258.1 copper/silver-translocating P-type ATPase [Chamaesiphon minutus PCC 6605]